MSPQPDLLRSGVRPRGVVAPRESGAVGGGKPAGYARAGGAAADRTGPTVSRNGGAGGVVHVRVS